MVEYAIFLARVEKNFAEAETFFQRALHMDKDNSDILGPYLDKLSLDFMIVSLHLCFSILYYYYSGGGREGPLMATNYITYFIVVMRFNMCQRYALYLEAERRDLEKAGEFYTAGYVIFLLLSPKIYMTFCFIPSSLTSAISPTYRYTTICLKPTLSDKDANLLCNYAVYLSNFKNTPNKAEELYKRVLVSHPDHTVANGMWWWWR